ncbi:MAG TPA: heparan-alpha-glucosaminide N-acetyltransferase domain-containing protein [Vicinamibacterales bacterium]
MPRLGYLDWLRGVATLLMIEAHTYDAWTRVGDRSGLPYRTAIALGGFAAPAFLFLAGMALALAAAARLRRGMTPGDVARLARRRGWQVFGLAFLFRLQSLLISGGRFPQALLKVDILNILGLSMVLAAMLWARGGSKAARAAWLGGVAAVIVLVAPALRGAVWLEPLPDWLEMYVRSFPGRTSFSLFPWPAFLLAGVMAGGWLADAADAGAERRVVARLGWVGVGMVAVGGAMALATKGGWEASFTTAPHFFLVRLGVLLMAVPAARAWAWAWPTAWSPVREFGVASLFVYWVHVEMAYGRPVSQLARSLTFAQASWGYLGLCLLLYGLVRLKTALWDPRSRAGLLRPRSGAT